MYRNIATLLRSLLLAYAAYAVCRIAFIAENHAALSLSWASWCEIWRGGLLFDSSAIAYTNALYIVMLLLPLHWKERRVWHAVAHWYFTIVNTAAVACNLADAVYFQYTARRTTMTVFSEFAGEENLWQIVATEFLRHWYLVLLAAALAYALWRWSKPLLRNGKRQGLRAYYATQTIALAVAVPLCVCAMRGGATKAVRPITVSNANQYADSPQAAAAVLNTPFSLLRTIGKAVFVVPSYYTQRELDAIYSPLHKPTEQDTVRHKNVVVIIVESFGREYIGCFNQHLEQGHYRGYTPFVDSLMRHSLTFDYSFCNGRKSIDAMPSILSSIPMFVEPFFLTPSAMNDVGGLARELGREGYTSAFFHGAQNGSMGFEAFARATGFNRYYGRTEYDVSPKTGGERDFDGLWAIWDAPFLQYYAEEMSRLSEPFLTAVFTATSHHPYNVPDGWAEQHPGRGICSPDRTPIHKCIRYTDDALRQFFHTARKQPWFKNTLFVLTSDHTNLSNHAYYQTALGGFCSPIIFYDPSGDIKPQRRHAIAQQIDIMPTVLGLLGHRQPYIAFGQDLTRTADADTWAVNYLAGIYQYVRGDYLLQYDGTRVKALYRFRTDPLLRHNLYPQGHNATTRSMERELKAIIQSYMERMTENRLLLEK